MTAQGPIKILQVIYDLDFGGSEKLAAFLADAMQSQRFKLSVLGLYGSGPIAEELENKKIPCFHFIPKSRLDARFGMQKKLFKLIKKEHIDIIQVHGSYPFTRVLPMAAITRTKVIYTEHAKKSLQSSTKLRTMTRIASVFCDKIVAVSYNLKDYLVDQMGISTSKVVVIHNGIDLNRFHGKKYHGNVSGLPTEKNGNLYIGIIGRLTDAKDHMGYFNALKQVVESEEKLIITYVIGDGELRELLQQQVKHLKLSDSVVFLGQRNDIPEIISRMDLMVLPSKREGLPISILESMAMGKPVIATRVGGIPEIISHGVNGYLIPPQDRQALAGAIKAFLNRKDRFSQMAEAGRKTIHEKFSGAQTKKAYKKLYEDVFSI